MRKSSHSCGILDDSQGVSHSPFSGYDLRGSNTVYSVATGKVTSCKATGTTGTCGTTGAGATIGAASAATATASKRTSSAVGSSPITITATGASSLPAKADGCQTSKDLHSNFSSNS